MTENTATATIPDDNRLIVLYRNFLDVGPAVVMLIVLMVAAVVFTIKVPQSVQYVEILGISLPVPFFALLPLATYAYILHRMYNNRYTISTDYVESRTGILSFKSADTRINFDDVRGIEVDRTIYQRIFNLGDILVGSAMGNEVEVRIEGVSQPDRLHQLIEQRMRLHRERAK